jgi:hypothetical protein
MHPSAMCNKFKQTNSIKTSHKTAPFNKYSPYVRTPLLNNPGRGLNRYDIRQLGYSPINLSELYIALEKYPRKDIAKLLKDGLKSGFKINYTGLRLQLDTKKIFSCLQYHVAAYERVEHDISIGRTTGPFRFCLISNLRCFPNGWTLITHLSYPPGNSFNDFIDEQLTTVQFSKFDNVISIIQTLGEHAKIGKQIY